MNYINHSGGCEGADMCWENEGKDYGVITIAYSFYNHVQHSSNQHILTLAELAEGWQHVIIAEKTLNRHLERIIYPYVRNLLSRNWYQVKNADAIFAISSFQKKNETVKGGTGWAVQMAIDNNKPVFLFEQNDECWYQYDYNDKQFHVVTHTLVLTENFAGIGSRNLMLSGKIAITEIYKAHFIGRSNP